VTLRDLLGIDIGTSGLKCVLIDEAGQLLASSVCEYKPDFPQPDWAEQDPDVWLNATFSAVHEALERSASQVAVLNRTIGPAQLAGWIGNPVMPGFMLSSLS